MNKRIALKIQKKNNSSSVKAQRAKSYLDHHQGCHAGRTQRLIRQLEGQPTLGSTFVARWPAFRQGIERTLPHATHYEFERGYAEYNAAHAAKLNFRTTLRLRVSYGWDWWMLGYMEAHCQNVSDRLTNPV